MSFQIREATSADFPRVVEILNSQVNEPITMETFLRQENARPAEQIFIRLVAVLDSGEIAGWGVTLHESTNRPGEFFTRVRVDLPYRGQGIGTALLQALETWAVEKGCTSMESGVREEETDAYAWAQHRGFATQYHLFESTLNLTQWDPAPFQDAVARAKDEGFRFRTLAQVTEGLEKLEMYRQLYDWLIPIIHDIPGNEDRPRMPFEEWHGWVKDDPDFNPAYMLLAIDADGTWAAIAHLKKLASGALYNEFTGVDRRYRGRGVTLALKVEALHFAKSLDAPYIRTNNLSVNPRILAVNKRLGYLPSPGHYLLVKKYDQA